MSNVLSEFHLSNASEIEIAFLFFISIIWNGLHLAYD